MKHLRFCSGFTAAVMLAIAIPVFSASATPSNITITECDDANRVVTVSGSITTSMQNEDVVLTVLSKDVSQATFESTEPESVSSVLSYFAQKPLESDGSFEFVFTLKGESGNYTVLIDSRALNGTYSDTIDFENTLWTELKVLKDDTAEGAVENFKAFIEREFTSLEVDSGEYNQLDNAAKNLVVSSLKNFPEDYNKENFTSEWDKNVIWTYIEANRNNPSALVEVVKEKHAAGNTYFDTSWMPFYLANYSDAAQEALYTRVLANPDCDTLDEFISGMNDALVITYVQTIEYWGDLYTIIQAENNVLGFNSASLTTFNSLTDKDTVVSNLYNGGITKTTSAEILSLFDALVSAQKTAESRPQTDNNNNNNTGGGGGGGTMGIPSVIKPVQVEDKPQPTTPPEEEKEPEDEGFTDIAGVEWAKEAIDYLAGKGILSGVGEGRFEPNRYMTREELIKMLDNAYGYSKDAADCDFADADKDAWYYASIAGAVNKGIINGYEDNTFGIGKYITRQDTAVILLRAAGSDSFSQKEALDFSDNDDISDYAKEAVSLLSGSGIISGMGDGSFMPKGNLTRAQAAKLFYGLLLHIEV